MDNVNIDESHSIYKLPKILNKLFNFQSFQDFYKLTKIANICSDRTLKTQEAWKLDHRYQTASNRCKAYGRVAGCKQVQREEFSDLNALILSCKLLNFVKMKR